jgi:hypothetical protein
MVWLLAEGEKIGTENLRAATTATRCVRIPGRV